MLVIDALPEVRVVAAHGAGTMEIWQTGGVKSGESNNLAASFAVRNIGGAMTPWSRRRLLRSFDGE